MTRTCEDLDKELVKLGELVKDYVHGSSHWNIVWERIDNLLEERDRIVFERRFGGNDDSL